MVPPDAAASATLTGTIVSISGESSVSHANGRPEEMMFPKLIRPFAFALLACASPVQSEDCTTWDLKVDAVILFLEEHYEPLGFVSIRPHEEDPENLELMEVDFSMYDFPDEDCIGFVQVTDDCEMMSSKGASLRTARERERTFGCAK